MTIYECKFFTYIYCPLYFIIEIYLYCLNFYYKNDKALTKIWSCDQAWGGH